jgi:hypothetical protein
MRVKIGIISSLREILIYREEDEDEEICNRKHNKSNITHHNNSKQ